MITNKLKVKVPQTNYVLSVKLYIPEVENLRGIVQLCHGLNEHTRRYEEFAEFLTEHGYVVFGADQLGHGDTAVESKLERGDVEYSGGVAMCDASLYAASVVLNRFQNLPWFIVAHSMGSIVTRLMAKENSRIKGIVLLGTNIAGPGVFFMYIISRIMCLFKGKNYKSKMIYKLQGKRLYGRVKGIERRAEWITHDKELLQQFLTDDTTRFKLPCKFYSELYKLNINAYKRQTFKPANPNIAVLVASGIEDPLADGGKTIEKIAHRYRKNGVNDVEMNLYMGCRHNLLHEVSRRDIFMDIVNWLDFRVKK